jgi:hypothetical protein
MDELTVTELEKHIDEQYAVVVDETARVSDRVHALQAMNELVEKLREKQEAA